MSFNGSEGRFPVYFQWLEQAVLTDYAGVGWVGGGGVLKEPPTFSTHTFCTVDEAVEVKSSRLTLFWLTAFWNAFSTWFRLTRVVLKCCFGFLLRRPLSSVQPVIRQALWMLSPLETQTTKWPWCATGYDICGNSIARLINIQTHKRFKRTMFLIWKPEICPNFWGKTCFRSSGLTGKRW